MGGRGREVVAGGEAWIEGRCSPRRLVEGKKLSTGGCDGLV